MAERKRNYKREYEQYQGQPLQKKERASRNAARREFMREGKVRKGDGLDVDHRDKNPLNDSKSNLRVRSVKANRSDTGRVYK